MLWMGMTKPLSSHDRTKGQIFLTMKNLGAFVPAATNYNFRRYYKKDFHF